MNRVPIKKTIIKKDSREIETYIVPSMPLKKSGGDVNKIPHPYGYDNLVFSSLEKAIEAINLAGFGYSFEDQSIPATEVPDNIIPNLTDAVDPLLKMLNDSNSGAVASAAFALGELKCSQAIGNLIEIIGKDDQLVRKNATEALAKIGEDSIRSLIIAIRDPNWVKRNSAAIAIGELTNYTSVNIFSTIKPLIQTLSDSNWIVRSSAANSIGKIAAYIRKNLSQQ